MLFQRSKDAQILVAVSEDKINNMSVADLLDFEALAAAAQGEDVPFKTQAAVNILARFMVDENGEPLARRIALNRIKRLTVIELRDAIQDLNAAFNTIEGQAVPNGQSGGSTA